MKSFAKVIAVIMGVVLVALLGWQVYQKWPVANDAGQPKGGRPAVAVEVVSVRQEVVRDVQVFTGTLAAKSSFVVAPKIASRLDQLLVHMGDPVKRDQLIAVLDDQEYQQQVDQAQAELEVAQAGVDAAVSALSVAKSEFDRAQALQAKNVLSQSELDVAQAQYKAKIALHKVALAQVAQNEAALRASQVRLSYTRIHASWATGDDVRVVGERFADEGALLKANDPIVSVMDITTLTAVVYAAERDYPKLHPGQEVVVSTDAYPAKTFAGRVIRVSPLLKEASREARVDIEVPNADRQLKPGMFVRARVEFSRHEGATVVPVAALARRNDRQGVFLADKTTMKAKFVPVEVGVTDGDKVEIVQPTLSGLVVTMGQHLLEDGSGIVVSEPAQPPSKVDTEVKDGERGAKS